MTRTLPLLLVTLGDPTRLSGGYLYHLRLAGAAAQHGFAIRFAGLATGSGPRAVAEVRRMVLGGEEEVSAVLLDSIAAARCRLCDAVPRRRPLVAIVHQPPGGMDSGPLRRVVRRRLDLSAYERARRIVAASESLRQQLILAGVGPDRITVVPPGCDPSPGTPAGGGSMDLRGTRGAAILCVSNWQRRKDILSLLDAFAMLPSGAATLHLAGDETAEPGYARRVLRRLGAPDLAGRVVRHGRLTSAEVAELYSAADVFALPSLVEPYGTVYAEAMAAGLPCVGWEAGNLPNLATPGRECLTASPGDVSGLGSALATLCLDEVERRRLGEAARRRAAGFPTWDATARSFFSTVRQVLEDGAGATP
ncbi:MAG: glycosyltransferase family 4 protein [Candidatus Dormibacteraeota bacterium]|nr:glycosyltransferase family 4 protein [Candidatus Dormibacteraeota bacterium]